MLVKKKRKISTKQEIVGSQDSAGTVSERNIEISREIQDDPTALDILQRNSSIQITKNVDGSYTISQE